MTNKLVRNGVAAIVAVALAIVFVGVEISFKANVGYVVFSAFFFLILANLVNRVWSDDDGK